MGAAGNGSVGIAGCNKGTLEGRIYVTDHPLVRTKLSIIRDRGTDPKLFRELVYEIGLYVGFQATASLTTSSAENKSGYSGAFPSHRLSQKVAFAPIMRGGIGLTQAMMELIPTAPVYHIGIYRERGTLQPVEYYNKLPESHQLDVCYVLDPMIATGGSAIAAVDILKEAGVPKIRFVSICVSQLGVRALLERHPDVEIYTAALDEELDAGGFIVPGLGDAGDRLFNTL